MIYDIEPCPKPRMTRADKWKKRPATAKYWAFKDECRLKMIDVTLDGASIVFGITMPKSWSQKKRDEYLGKPHRQVPDLDNFIKGLGDALYDDDSCIASICASKVWAARGYIAIGAKRD